MRRFPIPFGIVRDTRATAPFAVVAVIMLLGAGISYAYFASLQSSRSEAQGLPSWSVDAMEALDTEAGRIEGVVEGILETAIRSTDGGPSGELVSFIGRLAIDGFSAWADANYPSMRGGITLHLEEPRLTVSTIYGTVTTGNALGQQVRQRLPVGIEAVGVAKVEVSTEGGGLATREVVVRSEMTVPRVLAAHQQNVLEYALADEGLVPMLIADAISARLVVDPSWDPSRDTRRSLVDRAIGAVQMSLFRADTLAPWLWDADGRDITGPDLLMLGGNGTVVVEAIPVGTIAISNPRTGEHLEVRMVPHVDWDGSPALDLDISNLWAAEAGGPSGAALARIDIAGTFRHDVAMWSGGELLGTLVRDIEFRDHFSAWTEDPDLETRVKDRFDLAQIEDWSDFRETMAVVSPPARDLVIDIDPALGPNLEIAVDGVALGLYEPGRSTVRNVLAGPHELWARPVGTGTYHGSKGVHVDIPAAGPAIVVPIGPALGSDPGAEFAFWFSLMSTFHIEDAGPVPHLERIAALAGYPPLPDTLRAAARDDLEALAFWVTGLGRHLDHVAGRWGDKETSDPLGTLRLADDVVTITELTLEMLVDLPREIAKVGRITVLLTSADGRAGFSVQCPTPDGVVTLIEGTEEAAGCTVRAVTLRGTVIRHTGNFLTALSVVGGTLSLTFDIVELANALEDGEGSRIAWASFDIGVDMAHLVLCALKVLDDLSLIALATVTKSVLTVVGAAIAVVATFLDAYRDAGADFWGAWDLLLDPGGFSAALRTAGFFSGVASLVTIALMTATLPTLTGVTLATAFTTAVLVATGVGLIVFAAIVVVWAIFNWDSVQGWFSGAAKREDLALVRTDVEGILVSTMELRARLNGVNISREVADARSERGIGLSLMHLRTECGDVDLVSSLGRADLYHLDGGSAQGRRARATCELGHWVEVLWREVDDLVDNGRPNGGGEASEGFRDDKGTIGSKDLDFDADILVSVEGGPKEALSQAEGGIGAFLDSIDPVTAADVSISLSIEGKVLKGALEDWSRALGSICAQLGKASAALARASKESAFVASSGAERAYTRMRGLVEVRLPDGIERGRVEVECQHGGVFVGGEVEEGPVVVEVVNGTAMVTVTGWSVTSRVIDHDGTVGEGEIMPTATCTAYHWRELAFGSSVLDHGKE